MGRGIKVGKENIRGNDGEEGREGEIRIGGKCERWKEKEERRKGEKEEEVEKGKRMRS